MHLFHSRLKQHLAGKGAVFTSKVKPTGNLLHRLGTLRSEGDGPERDETLIQMYTNWPNKVRGWKYCGSKLTAKDLADIESNLRELFDLCRRCGRPGHFANHCTHTHDRNQKLIHRARNKSH